MKKTPVAELAPNHRNSCFSEVVLGYDSSDAQIESMRCLECKTAPCMKGCPVGVDIPGFIHYLKQGNIQSAYDILTKDNLLPSICGRVCPQESQCEGRCVRNKKGEAVAIGRLERFVGDTIESDIDYSTLVPSASRPDRAKNYKAAVIGSGPAGLTCAAELARNGVQVTLFEALHEIGGVLSYGIPEFRLPKKLLKREQAKLESLGVEIKTNTLIGRSYTIDQLKEMGFDSIFIGSGAGLPRFMDIPGENLLGVYSANEYLTRVNLMKAYEENAKTPIQKGGTVVVVGGGNVAMDAARTAKRLGAKSVKVVYRRSEEELPARLEEIHHAKEEGIDFVTLHNPVELIGRDSKLTAIKCQRMVLGAPDESGRCRPVPVEGETTTIDCNTVVIAIGQTPNPLIKMTTPELETTSWGGIIADQNTAATNLTGIYAGGDAVTGAATVILAMGAGKSAAKTILENIPE